MYLGYYLITGLQILVFFESISVRKVNCDLFARIFPWLARAAWFCSASDWVILLSACGVMCFAKMIHSGLVHQTKLKFALIPISFFFFFFSFNRKRYPRNSEEKLVWKFVQDSITRRDNFSRCLFAVEFHRYMAWTSYVCFKSTKDG